MCVVCVSKRLLRRQWLRATRDAREEAVPQGELQNCHPWLLKLVWADASFSRLPNVLAVGQHKAKLH